MVYKIILAGGVSLGAALSMIGLTASYIERSAAQPLSVQRAPIITADQYDCTAVSRAAQGAVTVYKCRDGRGGYVNVAVGHSQHTSVALTR